mgnify:CR=1 FL=1
MSGIHSLRGLALALGVVGLAGSCTVPDTDLVAPAATRGDMFGSYVAIGNSITAGFQSSGIIDSTQRRSYAYLLALSMGTRFAYPSIAGRGCPPLVTNFQTQARPAGTSAGTCDLRNAATAEILNNVAVPGAWSIDPTVNSSATSNTLTTLFLGGKSQVQRAMMAKPTFASVWIGNNDLLGPAVSSGGTATSLATITSQTAFEANYNAMIDSLLKSNAGMKGVLVGVVNVVNAPIMFSADAFATVAGFKATFDAIACGGTPNSCAATGNVTLLDASCTTAPGNTALINTFLAHQIRAGAHPSIIACAAGIYPAPVGDILILTAAEQATVTAAVTAYNTYISNKATALGWAYYDLNPTLVTLKSAGIVVRRTPNYLVATGSFGTGMSLDGVHPSASVHLTIANALITAINTKYGTALPAAY